MYLIHKNVETKLPCVVMAWKLHVWQLQSMHVLVLAINLFGGLD